MSFSNFEIADIIFKSLKSDLTPNEKQILNNWLNSSKENKACYNRVILKSNFVDRQQFYNELAAFKNYDYIKKHIQRKNNMRYIRYTISSVAAVVICVVGWYLLSQKQHTEIPKQKIAATQKITPGKAIAILQTAEGNTIHLGTQTTKIVQNKKAVATSKGNMLSYAQPAQIKTKQTEVYNTLKIPRGGEYQLQLSDGTKIWLNSETTIKYPVQFLNNERVVFVSGEAFFDVAPNKKRPFIVKTEANMIKVLGTSFNVRAYKNEEYQQTTLVTGRVNINQAGKISSLLPSQQYSYNKRTKKVEIKKVDVNLYTSWKDGLFIFKSQKLNYILNEISRWYNVDFIYEDIDLKNYVFSGRLKKYENANALLQVFEKTGNIKFKKEAQQIYVKKIR